MRLGWKSARNRPKTTATPTTCGTLGVATRKRLATAAPRARSARIITDGDRSGRRVGPAMNAPASAEGATSAARMKPIVRVSAAPSSLPARAVATAST